MSFTPKGEITDIKEAFKNLDKKSKNLKDEILNILKAQYKLWKKDKKVNEKTLSFSEDLLEILEYDTKNLKGACKKAWIKDLEEEADAIYDSMYSFKMERDNPEKFKKLEARIQKAISLEYAIMEKLKALRANQNIASLSNKEILKNYKEIFEGALEKEIAEILFVVLQNDDEESALEIIKKACKEDIIDEDFDIYLPELRLNTPILIAVAFFNRAKIISYLLSQDYEIDRSDFGNTPLFLAAKKGHIESAKVLIKNGADIDYINCFNEKLLLETILANLPQSTAMCELLIESGAKVDNKMLEATKAKLSEAENEKQKKAIQELIAKIESKL
ncbi:ankyrin repeat domain-containing protein [Helicobacter trogontum]|nr:ankyrin repeat domain-containing protein [Helicobacter trogontum]